jgi:hypothetical protein
MSKVIHVVLALFLCSGVTLVAQDRTPGFLGASVDREARLLAVELSARDLPSEDSTAVKAPLAQAQRSDDWSAVRGLNQGTRVQVMSRQGQTVTGRVIDVSQTAISTDRGTFLRDEVLAVYQARRYTTKQWVGIGAVVGAGAGLAVGAIADSRCRQRNCDLELGTTFGPILGGLYGSLSGLFLGGITNRNPPRLIYRGPPTAEGTRSSVSTVPAAE